MHFVNSYVILKIMKAFTPLDDLDWPKFLSFAQECARTPYGKIKLKSYLDPKNFAQTPLQAQELQNETLEVYSIIDEKLYGVHFVD